MFDDNLEDLYIIDQIRERRIEEESHIQLEIPISYDVEYVNKQKKEHQEPKRVIIIEL
jgi:hypothetical protein